MRPQGGVPAVEHQGVHRAVTGKDFLQLRLDESGLFRCERQGGPYAVMCVQDREMVHDFHSLFAQRFGQLLQYIAVQGRIHYAVVRGGGVPHTEAGVVLDRYADELGTGAFGHFHPLVRVQLHRIENLRGKLRIGPVGLLESGQAEVDEHPETEVHKLLLQLVQAPRLGQGRKGQGQQHETGNQSFHFFTTFLRVLVRRSA